MGILGYLAAGAVSGAGQAAQTSLLQQQKDQAEKDKIQFAADVKQAFEAEQGDLNRSHADRLQAAQHQFQADQNEANRNLTREQIASQQKIAASNNSVALKIAQIGGSVQSDKDGNVLFIGKDGTVKPLMDPNNPGQPLKGGKDLTPAAKQYAEVLKSQLIDLDKSESNGMGDQAKIDARRADLNAKLLNVLTGGIDTAKTSGSSSSPYPDGTELKDKSGNIYVVKGGVPVPKNQQSSTTSSRSKSQGIIAAQTYNEAGYSDVQNTIAGAKRGDKRAKSLLTSMLEEGGLSQADRQSIEEALR